MSFCENVIDNKMVLELLTFAQNQEEGELVEFCWLDDSLHESSIKDIFSTKQSLTLIRYATWNALKFPLRKRCIVARGLSYSRNDYWAIERVRNQTLKPRPAADNQERSVTFRQWAHGPSSSFLEGRKCNKATQRYSAHAAPLEAYASDRAFITG